ncbi:MAG: hypothetical protein ACLR8P_21625 [Clostridium fessum]
MESDWRQFPSGAVVGLILGILAALKKIAGLTTICAVISVLGVSLPSYVFALVMAYFIGWQGRSGCRFCLTARVFFASSIMPMLALSMFTVATVRSMTRDLPSGGAGQRLPMPLAESKGNHGTPASGAPCAPRNALDPGSLRYYGAAGCSIRWLVPGYREDLSSRFRASEV